MDTETRQAFDTLAKTMEKGFASIAADIADLRHTMEQGFASVAEDIADLQGESTKLNERLSSIETGLVTLKSGQLALESKVDGINHRLDTEAMTRQDQKLPERVATIEQLLELKQQAAA